MSSGVCLTCGCGDLVPNPFDPQRCLGCQHNHKRPPQSKPKPASPRAKPPQSQPQSQQQQPATPTPTPTKGHSGGVMTAELPGKKKKKKGLLGLLSRRMSGGSSTVAEPVITGPTSFKRGAHIGFSESGGFEVSNLPPELAALISSINAKLREVGELEMSKGEAAQLLSNMDLVKSIGTRTAPSVPSTPSPLRTSGTPPVQSQSPQVHPKVPTEPSPACPVPGVCPSCKAKVGPEQKFCTGCGTKVVLTPPAVPQTAKPPTPGSPGAPRKSPSQATVTPKSQLATSSPPVTSSAAPSAPHAVATGAAGKASASLAEIQNLRQRVKKQEEQIAELQKEARESQAMKETMVSLHKDKQALADSVKGLQNELSDLKSKKQQDTPKSVTASPPTSFIQRPTTPPAQGQTKQLEAAVAEKDKEIKKISEELKAKKAESAASLEAMRSKLTALEREQGELTNALATKDVEVRELQAKLRIGQMQGQETDKQRIQVDKELKEIQQNFENKLKQAREAEAKTADRYTKELEALRKSARDSDAKLEKELAAKTAELTSVKQQQQSLIDEVRELKESNAANQRKAASAKSEAELAAKHKEEVDRLKAHHEEEMTKSRSVQSRALSDLERRLATKEDRISELEAEIDRLVSEDQACARSVPSSSAQDSESSPQSSSSSQSAPPPPPPPPPPPLAPGSSPVVPRAKAAAGSSSPASKPTVDNRGGLLSSIREGASLKHVDVQEKPKATSGSGVGGDLASILAQALISRRTEIRDDEADDDDGADSDGEANEEWEDGSAESK